MTRRERLERKQEKREEWADKATARSGARFDTAHKATEGIPFGQPILVGHHSEKRHRAALAKHDTNMRKAIDESALSSHHASKADGIERQLDTSIFSDDADAIEQLETRIAEREAERDRWKEYNKTCRKGQANLSLLDDDQRRNIEACIRVQQAGPNLHAPSYIMSNLGGNIRSDRERIKTIKARAARAQRAEDAGGVLIVERNDWCTVTFAERPERSILRELKDAGFGWGGGSWNGYASKLPESVREMKGGAV